MKGGIPVGCAFHGPFTCLYLFPGNGLRLSRSNIRRAEHMGVTADHFLGYGSHHIVKIEMAGLLRHLGIENDLKH